MKFTLGLYQTRKLMNRWFGWESDPLTRREIIEFRIDENPTVAESLAKKLRKVETFEKKYKK